MALDTTTAAVPPMPSVPPAPVTLSPVPPQAAPPAEQEADGWWVQAVARLGTGWSRLQAAGAAWLMAAELDDLETALAEVAVDRDRRNERAIGAQQRDLRKLRRAVTAEAEEGDADGAARMGLALGSVAQAGPELVVDAITRRDITHLRWRRRGTRIGIVLAAGYAVLTATAHEPVIAPLELLAALITVWVMGRPQDQQEEGQAVGAGQQQAPAADQAQAATTAAAPDSRTEEGVTSVVPPFVTPVDLAKRDAARVRGELDLVTAFAKAGIIRSEQIPETHTVGGLREDGPGWTATVELPRGVKAAAATSRVEELASALRLKRVRIEMTQDSGEDGHEGRVRLWVANSDSPYGKAKTPSALIDAPVWDFWHQGVPLGADARGARQVMHLLWSSLMVGGLMGYGKSYFARLVAAAAALDPTVRIIVVTGKTGPDWAPLKHIAHRYIAGATPDIIREVLAVMEGTIEEMQDRGTTLEELYETDPDQAPEGKITPALAAAGMGPVLLVVDELQELLDGAALVRVAVDDDNADSDKPGRTPTRSGKDVLVESFARYVRVTRFVGGMGVFITQRPDANSVPTALREVCAKRASCRVKGDRSAKMVLGDDAVAGGAAPHMLTEDSKGVVVLDQGGEEGHVTLKADVIDLPEFKEICLRGRTLREAAGTLTGDATTHGTVDPAVAAARILLADAIAVLDGAGVDRARTDRLVELLTAAHPDDRYEGLTGAQLQARLRDAGAGTTRKLGAIDGMANPNGYTREQLDQALAQHGK
ncbi:hypothetical protein [Actinacidiphila yeochonensis]|uniref:hypothetical protein n=1 Tax=Actinacidiphila yeochonensis TaxID=89050 RepID=UPI000560E976|nr:hypothetical protein [Actinacidiphila yeochonensis]